MIETLAVGLCSALAAAAWRRRGRREEPRSGVIFTGTGSSSGCPMLRCAIGGEGGVPGCRACRPAQRGGRRNPNWRNNVGLVIRWFADGQWRHLQIDCGKTFRDSVLLWYKEHQIHYLDAVLLTHDHADAILGLDELRQLQRFDPQTRQVSGPPLQCFCDGRTLRHCRRAFPYLFPKEKALGLATAWCQCNGGCNECDKPTVERFVATIDWQEIPEDTSAFHVAGLTLHALPVLHGADYLCFGYGFGPAGGRVVYISDYTQLLPKTEALLKLWSQPPDGIELMILDVLHPDATRSPVHACLEESLDLVRRFRPRKAFFVGMGHYCEHFEMNRKLRLLRLEGLDVQLAHDGLFLPISLASERV
ncbi:unnamed protein product [Effrenium voratum]|nr:unnamed protein product [Effrenium voratum]